MVNCASSREKSKSPQRGLVHRLTQEAGLNLAQARLVHELLVDFIEDYYLDKDRLSPGTMIHCAVSAKEPPGKPIKHCEIVPIALTPFQNADIDVLHQKGSVDLRALRLYRWAYEAKSQGALLSYEDLSVLLCVDVSTVKNLVKYLRSLGMHVPTRGAVLDIGPKPSHKRIIAELLARGLSTSQIRAATNHSEHAIARYQHQFGFVIYLLRRYPEASADTHCLISQLSRPAYDVYREVIQRLSSEEDCKDHLTRLSTYYELDPDASCQNVPFGKRGKNTKHRLDRHHLTTAIRHVIEQDLRTTSRVAQIVADDLQAIVDDAFKVPASLRPGELVIFADTHDREFISGESHHDRSVIPVKIPLHTKQIKELWRNTNESVGIRRAKIASIIANAALEQGGILSIANLAELLHSSPSTLAKNLREFAVQQHTAIPTHGFVEDAGPTLTHKDWIIDLDRHGLTGEQISFLTRHAPISRDRYIETYRRAEILMRLEGTIPQPDFLARVLKIRPHVARQYVDLLHRYHPDQHTLPSTASPPQRPASSTQ